MEEKQVRNLYQSPRVRSLSAIPPTKGEIKKTRKLAGVTMSEAAQLVYIFTTAWRDYENGDANMHPAIAELFAIKTGLHPDYIRRPKP